MLTTGQVAHFETFGFLMLKGLFSDAEVRSIRRDYDSVWNEAPGGHPFTGERTEARMPFCERRRSLSKLAEDDRIYEVVEQLLGPQRGRVPYVS